MNQEDKKQQVTDFLLGELDAEATKSLEQELKKDPELRAYLAEMNKVLGLVQEATIETEELSEDRRQTLQSAARAINSSEQPAGQLLEFQLPMKWVAAVLLVAGGLSLFNPNADIRFGDHHLGLESETSASASDVSVPRTDSAEPTPSSLVQAGKVVADSENKWFETLNSLGSMVENSQNTAPAVPIKSSSESVFKAKDDAVFDKLAFNNATGIGGGAGGSVSGGGAVSGKVGAKHGARGGKGGRLISESLLRRRAEDFRKEADVYVGLKLESLQEIQDAPIAEESLGLALGDRLQAERERGRAGFRYSLHDGYGRTLHGPHILRHIHRQPQESPRDMFFRYYGDNAFVPADADALSTFAADVDTASWALARNYLTKGNVPPKGAIRTEEFLNWFDHGLVAPKQGDFAVTLQMAPSRYRHQEGVSLLQIGIKAREIQAGDRKPFNLVFVVDRSGSMKSGDRMEMVKRSLELLVDQLRKEDTVGIVSFESKAHLELEPTAGTLRWKIREAVRGIEMGGSTNAEAGLLLGYEMAERAWREEAVNRVILCSDGVANTGETDQERILEKVRSFAERDIDLTTIGVGMGNHNDVFLERLANKGNGACHYVDDYDEAKRVFVERFTGTMQTIARDVKIQVEFNPGILRRWRQLGYENRAVADQDFRNDAVDAGEIGAGHEVTALYELESHIGVALGDWIAKVRVRWFPDGSDEAQEQEWRLALGEGSSRWELASRDFRRSNVTAQFAEFLRRSYWARGDSFDQLLEDAQNLVREDPADAQMRELRDLIKRTKSLVTHFMPPQDDLTLLIEESYRLNLLVAEAETKTDPSEEIHAKLQEIRRQNDELEEQIRKLLEG